jgi:hypothetical protein
LPGNVTDGLSALQNLQRICSALPFRCAAGDAGRAGRPFGAGRFATAFAWSLMPDMRVPHRHVDVRMPGKLLGLRQRRTVAEQLRDMCMPPRRVEVGDPFLRLIWNADPLKVLLDHEPGLPVLKNRRSRWLSFVQIHGDEVLVARFHSPLVEASREVVD